MQNKLYNIYLENKWLGTSALEKADAPMGVVFGLIHFINEDFGFDFWKDYCEKSNLIASIIPEDRLIITKNIKALKVYSPKGIEIQGTGGVYIEGMDSEGFEIAISGIDHQIYQLEFPHHVEVYEKLFQ